MADKSAKATAAIESLFARKPDATLDEFLAVAVKADPSLEGIAKRSFNARYLLPMKRAAAPKKKRRTKKKVAAKQTATRKKRVTRKKKATRRRGRPAASSGRSQARRLVLERDQQLLDALRSNGDPQAAYELAAGIDDFVEKLAATLRG
jgi:hypothetical protein